MTEENKNLLIYVAKCVSGCILVFFLSWLFNYHDISWCIISAMLVLTPESKEAVTLALVRIKANLIAGAMSFLCLLIFPASPFTITFTIALTILACYKFNAMTGSRAAIAAVIIIMLHGMEADQPSFWSITLQRISAVIIGCILGLIITLVFHKNVILKNDKKGKVEEG